MFYRFCYRDLFKIDIYQDSLDDAIDELSKRGKVFGIDPLDFDCWYRLDYNDDSFFGDEK